MDAERWSEFALADYENKYLDPDYHFFGEEDAEEDFEDEDL